EQRVELQLHPAELGPLSVSLKLGDQGAQAQLLSAHAQVRQALEQAIPQLREALAEQGIQLGEATVGEQREGSRDGRDFEHAERAPQLGGGDTPGDEVAAAADSVRELPVAGRVSVYA
ncbi:MAG TPA: flagellar hook-length control protein FliK, partial [Halomonas sp.]|nr:flagellar hook-length control protein FliK [Halomonas sp.]